MIFDQGVLDTLEGIAPARWEGHVWRAVFDERNPLLANRTGARWNPRDTAALYTSLSEKTVLAELDHLRSVQYPPARRATYRICVIHVRVDRMLDLRSSAVLGLVGVGSRELAADEHSACQQVGGAAAWLGCDAILVPSARSVGDNLVVFVDKQDPDAPLEVVETQEPQPP